MNILCISKEGILVNGFLIGYVRYLWGWRWGWSPLASPFHADDECILGSMFTHVRFSICMLVTLNFSSIIYYICLCFFFHFVFGMHNNLNRILFLFLVMKIIYCTLELVFLTIVVFTYFDQVWPCRPIWPSFKDQSQTWVFKVDDLWIWEAIPCELRASFLSFFKLLYGRFFMAIKHMFCTSDIYWFTYGYFQLIYLMLSKSFFLIVYCYGIL